MPAFFMIQPQRSCSITTWHPQPQNQRPRIAVEASASAKKMKPTVTTPYLRVSIASEGSIGASVVPVIHHWTTCAMINNWTMPSTTARFHALRLLRIGEPSRDSGPDPPSPRPGSTVSEIDREDVPHPRA